MADIQVLEKVYDPLLVILSMAVAALAVFVALAVAMRIWPYTGRRRQAWVLAAAATMGGGIWSTHFLAMLAIAPPVSITYDLPLTLASLAFVLLVTAMAFAIVTGRDRQWLLAAGVLMALGIVAMHYTGMAAMRMPAVISYDPPTFTLFQLVAIAVASAVLWSVTRIASLRWRVMAALAIAAALSCLHYCGMAAASFVTASSLLASGNAPVGHGALAALVAIGTLVLLAVAFAAAVADRRVAARLAQASEALKEAVSKLTEQERLAMIGNLAGKVSQELRSPLATTHLSLSIIRQEAADREHVERAVARAERGIQRCTAIIYNLLEFLQPGELAREPTQIDPWLRQQLQEFARGCGVVIRRDLRSDAELPLDRASFSRAIRNLLQNAVQALSDPAWRPPLSRLREIVVRTEMVGRRLRLSVTDTGPGIPADQLPLIFEPLFSTRGFGAGLGLPLLRQIIARHGGTVAVESTPEAGTRFTIELPCDAVEIARAA